jgi:hypothetical protein
MNHYDRKATLTEFAGWVEELGVEVSFYHVKNKNLPMTSASNKTGTAALVHNFLRKDEPTVDSAQEEEEDLDETYPPDDRKLIAVTGSVSNGFEYWGPFDSMKEAVDWAESKKPFIGWTHISYLKDTGLVKPPVSN